MPKQVKFTLKMRREDVNRRKEQLQDLLKQGVNLYTALEYTKFRLIDKKKPLEYVYETWEEDEL